MKIVFGTAISLQPYSPGKVWHRMQYALGLQKLGHEVFFVEEVEPSWCVNERGQQVGYEQSLNRSVFHATMKHFGIKERACQIYDDGEVTFGLSRNSLTDMLREADLLINWSGHLKTELVLSEIKRRVYVDQDPVYTQFWHAEYDADLNFDKHDIFVSVGLNIGTSHNFIPDNGIRWQHTLPPVILDYWPVHFKPLTKRFTTIASWGSYKDLKYGGTWYRGKSHEFERFARLPKQVRQEFEIMLKDYSKDDKVIKKLRDGGWHIYGSSQVSTVAEYQAYIAQSRAEIGIAKNAYVKGRSGWFSDRSACYLATGKPVLAQSTGFESLLPTDRGLLTFRTMEEAVASVDAINHNYEKHCRAAREFAEEYLDYKKVLPKMLAFCTE